jgi:ubiquinone/menaquinone biosynthesis C-methylase UbiE
LSDRQTLLTRGEPSPQLQKRVTLFFDEAADYWTGVYSSAGVFADIYRLRLEMALAWVEALALPPGARVLAVGAGAGFEVIALANQGYALTAVDPATAMIEVARKRAQAAGCRDVQWVRGDAHALGFAPGSFDLVVALGVIPWLHSPGFAMAEMGRVLRAGGWWLGSADNPFRLDRLLDPARNPVVAPLSRRVRNAVMRHGPAAKPTPGQHSARALRRLLDGAGVDSVAEVTFGFGPFTLLGRSVLPEALGEILNARLTELARRGAPVARMTGAQCLALGRKRVGTP